MKLFRIARASHINDLSGTGARLYGGRWNDKGVAVIYTSESRSLAALEYLVHVTMRTAPSDLNIIEFDIPDHVDIQQIDAVDLPPAWESHPPPESLRKTGSDWARSNKSLLLRVPSAVIEEEFNVLINPMHPDIKLVKIFSPERFAFDGRLLL